MASYITLLFIVIVVIACVVSRALLTAMYAKRIQRLSEAKLIVRYDIAMTRVKQIKQVIIICYINKECWLKFDNSEILIDSMASVVESGQIIFPTPNPSEIERLAEMAGCSVVNIRDPWKLNLIWPTK